MAHCTSCPCTLLAETCTRDSLFGSCKSVWLSSGAGSVGHNNNNHLPGCADEVKLYINRTAGRGHNTCQPPSLHPRKKYLSLGSSPRFFLGGERPASGFQLEQSSPFSFFFAFSLSSPFSPLGDPGESEYKRVAVLLNSAVSQSNPT